MRAPAEWNKNLRNNIITEDMLVAALHSANKRAKNWRDEKRTRRHDYDREAAEREEKKQYALKDKLLSALKPVRIHQEFAGHERTRIYDYECKYAEKFVREMINENVVYINSYFDREAYERVEFFDCIDKTKPLSRWYLYYIIKNSSFHVPIDEQKARNYAKSGLEIVKIPRLVTTGEDESSLVSENFVCRVAKAIECGAKCEKYSITENDLPTGWEHCSDDILIWPLDEIIAFAYGDNISKEVIARVELDFDWSDVKPLVLTEKERAKILNFMKHSYKIKRKPTISSIERNVKCLKLDVDLQIDYSAAKMELKKSGRFKKKDIIEALVKFLNVEDFKHRYAKALGKRRYFEEHFDEFLNEATLNV